MQVSILPRYSPIIYRVFEGWIRNDSQFLTRRRWHSVQVHAVCTACISRPRIFNALTHGIHFTRSRCARAACYTVNRRHCARATTTWDSILASRPWEGKGEDGGKRFLHHRQPAFTTFTRGKRSTVTCKHANCVTAPRACMAGLINLYEPT